jgi:hypothetical protein
MKVIASSFKTPALELSLHLMNGVLEVAAPELL